MTKSNSKKKVDKSTSALKQGPVIKLDWPPRKIKIVPHDRNLSTTTKVIKVNGNVYEFTNTYKESEIVFTHDCLLHIGSQTFSYHTYYNYDSGHEPYDFTAAMRGALNKYRKEIEKPLKKDFLAAKGYQRLAYNIQDDFEALLAKNAQWQELNTVLLEIEKA